MLATFRNIAAIIVTWYLCSFVGDVLGYGAQFMFGVVGDRERPGTVVLMHLVSGLPDIVVSLLAGAIAAAAVRPKGKVGWVAALASLYLVRYVGSTVLAYSIGEWGVEDFIGIILVAGLLSVGVCVGGFIIRKRAQNRG